MRNARCFGSILAALVTGVLAWPACTAEDDDSAGGGGDAGDASVAAWSGACASCLESACAAEVQSCGAESSCSAAIPCFAACAAEGPASVSCVDACPAASGTSAQMARAELATCVTSGAQGTCSACVTADASGDRNPIIDQTCSPSSETDACFVCEDEQCCETYAECSAEPECVAFGTCMRDCADALDECVTSCEQQHPTGAQTYVRRLACVLHQCAPECSGFEDTCRDCTQQKCGPAEVACNADVECFKLVNCAGSCGKDEACINQCKAQYPASVGLFDDFAGCTILACEIECA